MLTITNEDCTALMARYPDKHFDLAIVDPPYGVGSITYMPQSRTPVVGGFFDRYEVTIATLDYTQRKKMRVDIVHGDSPSTTNQKFGDENVAPGPEYFTALFRVSKNQIIWGGNYFLLPPTRGFVVWNKFVSESFSMAMCEYAWTSFQQNAKMFAASPVGNAKNPRIHPTQKPVALYKWLLANYAKPGQRILDTHLGSGSIAIACHELGFDLTACEIDKDYFDKAMERIERHQKQQTLFDHKELHAADAPFLEEMK
jgi:site-specific DNA-methyltransferase (adenine-specific)